GAVSSLVLRAVQVSAAAGGGAPVGAAVAARCVRVALVDEAGHELDHLGDVPGGPRLDGGRQAAERVVRPREVPVVALGDDEPGHAFLGGHANDLVVDVGDVPAEPHVISEVRQPAPKHVEINARPDMSDVWRSLHGGTAQVYRHSAWFDRYEFADRTRAGVV